MSRIEKFKIRFDYADEDRVIHVYLPDGYDEHTDERYPVMYMWDGQNMFLDSDATFGKSWGMKTYLDRYWKKVIVVGMECAHTSPKRCNEYCPYPVRIYHVGKVEGAAYHSIRWLIDVVKPYIDQTYRTWSHREATAMGGSSMGGMISLYAAIKYNDVFSKFAVVSPAVSMAMTHFMNDIEFSAIHPDTRIIFTWGTEEWITRNWEKTMHRNILKLEMAIQIKQPECRTYRLRQEGGLHNEATWESQLPVIVPFLWE